MPGAVLGRYLFTFAQSEGSHKRKVKEKDRGDRDRGMWKDEKEKKEGG